MQPTLFDEQRMNMCEAMDLTAESLEAHAGNHHQWAIAWSGGKDSTALLSLVLHLIDSGRIAGPEKLTVYYADTRMELLPLYFSGRSSSGCGSGGSKCST